MTVWHLVYLRQNQKKKWASSSPISPLCEEGPGAFAREMRLQTVPARLRPLHRVNAMSAQQGRLSQRLSAFKQKFSQLLGPKQHGYGELGQLEQPLVGHQAAADTDSAYMQQHGVPRPGSQAPASQGAAQYDQPVLGQQGQWQAPPGGAPTPASANAVPDPVRDGCSKHSACSASSWGAFVRLLHTG